MPFLSIAACVSQSLPVSLWPSAINYMTQCQEGSPEQYQLWLERYSVPAIFYRHSPFLLPIIFRAPFRDIGLCVWMQRQWAGRGVYVLLFSISHMPKVPVRVHTTRCCKKENKRWWREEESVNKQGAIDKRRCREKEANYILIFLSWSSRTKGFVCNKADSPGQNTLKVKVNQN